MSRINAYLTFNGNCREAMTFYRNCLGGELVLETLGDSPMGEHLPLLMRKRILQATLTRGELVLKGTDMVGEHGLIRGNAVSLMLHCSSEREIRDCYAKLVSGGRATHPLEETFWGTVFGDLRDKFGNHWLLTWDASP